MDAISTRTILFHNLLILALHTAGVMWSGTNTHNVVMDNTTGKKHHGLLTGDHDGATQM